MNMEQRLLGTTGLQVSRLALGTMTWDRGTDEETARAQVHAFLDAGGNLIDTADVYADGMSERILGSILEDPSVRSRSIIATKAVSRPGTPRRFDASRQHILQALDRSLERLGVDHVDIWQMHVWDAFTPIEETLAAMDDAVRSGRVNYIGVSNYSGWQLAQAVTWSTHFCSAASNARCFRLLKQWVSAFCRGRHLAVVCSPPSTVTVRPLTPARVPKRLAHLCRPICTTAIGG